jgi:hypothetical protein
MKTFLYRIKGSYGRDCEECFLSVCDAVYSGRISPIFRKKTLPPSLDPKKKTSKKESKRAAAVLLFNPDEGGIMSSQTTRPYGVIFRRELLLKSCMILLLDASDIISLGRGEASRKLDFATGAKNVVSKVDIFVLLYLHASA